MKISCQLSIYVGRSKKIVNSPVHDLSNALNIPIYFPENAKDEQFLAELDSLKVDMCITAAYGNYLPKRCHRITILLYI